MIVKFNGQEINVPEGTGIEEVKESLKAVYPELANAEALEIEGGYELRVQSNTKGSDEEFTQISFNGTTIDVPAGLSVEQARESLKAIYPEVANATPQVSGGVLTFTVQSNTKG